MAQKTLNKQRYFIIGPPLQPENGVEAAVYALFYLPEHYHLILPAASVNDRAFFDRMVALVYDSGLQARVHFGDQAPAQATTPEAFASAVFRATRALA